MYGKDEAVRPEKLPDGSSLRPLIMSERRRQALEACDPAESRKADSGIVMVDGGLIF